MLTKLSGIKIRDKGGSFIGLRMGRPEAAKPRKMVGDPMTLFPIGTYGGPTRSINKAAENQKMIDAELAYFVNPETKKIEEQPYSLKSNIRNTFLRKCTKCAAYSNKNFSFCSFVR